MRKQAAPTEISNQGFGGVYNQGYQTQDGHTHGFYDPAGTHYTGPPSLLATRQPGGISLGKQDIKLGGAGQARSESAQQKPVQEQPVKESAAVASTKQPVESETTYPAPHKPSSLLGIFFTDPGQFEGNLG